MSLAGAVPAQGNGGLAHALDQLECRQPLLLNDDLTEQRTEQLDLARQWIARAGRADAARFGLAGRV